MRELHFFDDIFLDDLTPDERRFYTRLHAQLPIPTGRPFFLNADGTVDTELDGFCRSLISGFRSSPATWETYAIQVNVYLRHLDSEGIDWKHATSQNIKNYYSVRTTGNFQSGTPIKAKSWNVAATAIVHLYEYALDSGLIEAVPFNYRTARGINSYGDSKTADIDAKQIDEPLTFISLKHYKNVWRPALLQTQNSQRDVTISDTLITTGLRISEMKSLKVQDIPDPDAPIYADRKSIDILVVGKGKKPRKVKFPKRIIRAIRFYISESREKICYLHGLKHGKNKAIPDNIFLSRAGKSLSNRRIEDIFMKISIQTGIKLIPHGCRHTFAIYQLAAMIKRLALNLKIMKEQGASAYDQIMQDPLRSLQKLLGHSRITSTYIYLDFIEESEALVEESLADWTTWEKDHEK